MCYLTFYVIGKALVDSRLIEKSKVIRRLLLLRMQGWGTLGLILRTPALFNGQMYLEWLSTSSPSQETLVLKLSLSAAYLCFNCQDQDAASHGEQWG